MKEQTKDNLMAALAWFCILIAIVAMCLPLGGCKAIREVEHVYVHDTVYRNKIMYDSVDRWHTHYEFIRGDTVHSVDTFYKDRWHLKTDTIHETKYVTNEVVKPQVVVKKFYVWQPFLVAFIALILLFLFRKKLIFWLKHLILKIR